MICRYCRRSILRNRTTMNRVTLSVILSWPGAMTRRAEIQCVKAERNNSARFDGLLELSRPAVRAQSKLVEQVPNRPAAGGKAPAARAACNWGARAGQQSAF